MTFVSLGWSSLSTFTFLLTMAYSEEKPARLWQNSMVSPPCRSRHSGESGHIGVLTVVGRPEDIFGSLQVDNKGNIEGNFQASGTYRIVTNEGM